jgi:hypothetical protein
MDNTPDVEHLLSSNRRRVKVQVDRLKTLLNAIKPAPGNFLFTDLVGRLVWNATATTNAIDQLADQMNDYGASSLLRKVFECKVLLEYMLTTPDKNAVIARIMAYEFFDASEVRMNEAANRISKEPAIANVRKIVEGFKEDSAIINHFKSMIGNTRSHWHWLGESFEKVIKRMNPDDVKYFKLYSEFAHIDVSEDRLEPTEEILYQSPVGSSRVKTAGILGLTFLINQDIIITIEQNRNLISFDIEAYENELGLS